MEKSRYCRVSGRAALNRCQLLRFWRHKTKVATEGTGRQPFSPFLLALGPFGGKVRFNIAVDGVGPMPGNFDQAGRRAIDCGAHVAASG